MTSIFSYPFFQHALFIGCLSSIVCGIMGCFIVLKRLSFLTASISHSILGGVGLSLLFGINPLLGAFGFGYISTSFMVWIQCKFKEKEDTLIGIIWTLGMSIGIICLSFNPSFSSDFSHYLFGNILLTTYQDIWIISCLNILIIGTIIVFFRSLQILIFDPTYAEVLNLPVFWLNFLLLQLITFSTVVLLKSVGGILLIALLTIPAATAKNMTLSLKKMIYISITCCILASSLGTIASYYLNLPSGPSIVISSCILYLLSLIYQHF